MTPTESELQAALLLAAPTRLPVLRLFRRNVAMVHAPGPRPRAFRAGIPGQADLYALVRGGLHVELELKAYGGRLSPNQEVWRRWCATWSVPYLLLTGGDGEPIRETVERWCIEIDRMVRQVDP